MKRPILLSDHFTIGKLLRFTVPSMVMMVFISIYSVVDGFFVSNFAGTTSFAALNLIFPFIMFLSVIGFVFGAGGTALIAKTLGEGKPVEANRIFSMLVYLGAICGVLFAAIGWPFLDEVSILLGADEAFRDFRFVIAGAPSRDASDYVIDEDLKGKVSVVFGDTYGVLRHAEAAVINSGTASLEAALVGTPQVVCWSTGPFAAFIGRKVLRIFDHVKYISLGNLCLDRLVFRELIQEDFTAPAVADEVRRLVADIPYREKMLSGYAEIKESLGGRGASRAVAASMIQTLKEIS